MELDVGEMLAEIQRELGENGTDIVLQWNAVAPNATPDPVDGSIAVANLTPQTLTLPAFVHQHQATGSSSVRQFNEVEVGDLILDFAGDVELPLDPVRSSECGVRNEDGLTAAQLNGARDLVFVINGKEYVAKEIGEKLAQSWDVTVQGQQLFRSVLVKVKG
jgi:hypothetical protein